VETPDDEVRPYADVPPAAEVPDDEVVVTDLSYDSRPRLVPAIAAGLGVALLGVALFAVVYVVAKREYPGVAVVIGFAVGWVMRAVARRSTVLVRVLAAVITAVAVIAGTVAGQIAYTAKEFHLKFLRLVGDIAPDTFTILRNRTGIQLAIYASAVVIAVLAAWPSKPKPAPATVVRDDDEREPDPDGA
jgi:hypothetical protein